METCLDATDFLILTCALKVSPETPWLKQEGLLGKAEMLQTPGDLPAHAGSRWQCQKVSQVSSAP